MSLYVGDRRLCRFGWNSIQTCTLDGHLHRVTYTRCINTTDSPDDEHRGARNTYRIGINIYEKRIVRQVGYLQEMKQLNLYAYLSVQPSIHPSVCLSTCTSIPCLYHYGGANQRCPMPPAGCTGF